MILHNSNAQQSGATFDATPSRRCETDSKTAEKEPRKSGGASHSCSNARFKSDSRATYRKKATRDKERSSNAVRDDANIERKTAGVTGIRLRLGDGGGRGALDGAPGVLGTYTELG